MLFNVLSRGALAAVAATAALLPSVLSADSSDSTAGQSTFVSPDRSLAFAFTVPDRGSGSASDVYFSLRVPTSRSWGAVGLGSDDMKGALFLMIYRNERGDNVTFSPRLAYGHYEPEFYPDVEYEVLDGTGVFDDHMVFNARCISHCRSWPARDSNSGYIDVSSKNVKAIYAVGPKEGFQSNDPEEGIKFHEQYGTFTIDMKRTKGSPDTPVLTDDSESIGTTLNSKKDGLSDWMATLHAVLMVFCIVALFPFGVILLKLGKLSRWHGLNQTVAMVGVLVGFAMGIVTSFKYQRSRGFDAYHQVLGIIITAFILGQFALGFLHHKQYKKTQLPTKFGRPHRWIGRAILFFGILNCFFGFTFAINRKYGMVLAGLIILMVFSCLLVIFGLRYLNREGQIHVTAPPAGAPPPSYQPGPWRSADPNANYPSEPPPGYEASSSSNVGLRSVSPSPWRRNSAEGKEFEDSPNLGSAQRPREFA